MLGSASLLRPAAGGGLEASAPSMQPGGFDDKFAVLAHTFEVASGATKVRLKGLEPSDLKL